MPALSVSRGQPTPARLRKKLYKWRYQLRLHVQAAFGNERPSATQANLTKLNAYRQRYGVAGVGLADFRRALQAAPVDLDKVRQKSRLRDKKRKRVRPRGPAQLRSEANARRRKSDKRALRRLRRYLEWLGLSVQFVPGTAAEPGQSPWDGFTPLLDELQHVPWLGRQMILKAIANCVLAGRREASRKEQEYDEPAEVEDRRRCLLARARTVTRRELHRMSEGKGWGTLGLLRA